MGLLTNPLKGKVCMYYVYLLTNARHSAIYTGVTNNLFRRVYEHRFQGGSQFTSKYKTIFLVYYEEYGDISSAILREKQIKAGSRKKKIDLIYSMNSEWKDLASDWY